MKKYLAAHASSLFLSMLFLGYSTLQAQTAHLNTNSFLLVDPASGFHITLAPGMLTANRIFNFPDSSGEIVTMNTSIPSGAYLAFPNDSAHNGFTNTGVIQAFNSGWSTKASDPTAQRGSAVGVVNNKIYVIGGTTEPISGEIDNNNCYDPSTNTWAEKSPLPTARRLVVGAVYDGIIYVIGGSIGAGAGTPQNIVEAYDPSTDSWTTKANMPTARWSPVATTMNGKIYVTGGRAGNVLTTATEEYDPVNDVWTTLAPIPTAYEGSASASINNKMYVFGGNDIGLTNYSDNFEYTPPPMDSWTARTNLPSPTTALGAVTLNGNIYLFGGCLAGVNLAFDSTTIYTPPSSDNYVSIASMPTARINPTVAVVNGRIYVIGGVNSSDTRLTTNEEYAPYGITLHWFEKN